MRVFAPGKLVLGGAYAVLEGHPALACAVSRGAIAHGIATTTAYDEIRAAGVTPAELDVSEMYLGDKKLGLGASAAALVATLALRAAESSDGAALATQATRARLFERAFAAHAQAQSGGSGVDVAASVFGGSIAFVMGKPPRPLRLPSDLVMRVYFSGSSASTQAMLTRVGAFRAEHPTSYAQIIDALGQAASSAIDAIEARGRCAAKLVTACRATMVALTELGQRADAPIVTADVARADATLARETAVFFPAGAGGGDCSVYVGLTEPSAQFERELSERGMVPLPLSVDSFGVRALDDSTALSSRN